MKRVFFGVVAVLLLAVLVGGCVPQIVEVTRVVKETVIVEKFVEEEIDDPFLIEILGLDEEAMACSRIELWDGPQLKRTVLLAGAPTRIGMTGRESAYLLIEKEPQLSIRFIGSEDKRCPWDKYGLVGESGPPGDFEMEVFGDGLVLSFGKLGW